MPALSTNKTQQKSVNAEATLLLSYSCEGRKVRPTDGKIFEVKVKDVYEIAQTGNTDSNLQIKGLTLLWMCLCCLRPDEVAKVLPHSGHV